MTAAHRFCTECGSALDPGMKFCGQCGHPVAPGDGAGQISPTRSPDPGVITAEQGNHEQVIGVIPFLEQGLLSVSHFTLIVTTSRMIFCPWKAETDNAMADAEDLLMQESCAFEETTDEIVHFRKKDWAEGPWQRYTSMAPDTILDGAPGAVSIPFRDILSAEVICETRTSTQDSLTVEDGKTGKNFDLMFSQGPFLFRLLDPVLGQRVSMADHLHRRRGLDRLLSGQEYK